MCVHVCVCETGGLGGQCGESGAAGVWTQREHLDLVVDVLPQAMNLSALHLDDALSLLVEVEPGDEGACARRRVYRGSHCHGTHQISYIQCSVSPHHISITLHIPLVSNQLQSRLYLCVCV